MYKIRELSDCWGCKARYFTRVRGENGLCSVCRDKGVEPPSGVCPKDYRPVDDHVEIRGRDAFCVLFRNRR